MTIISIVTPSYNQGEFIEETIQSVISQKGNFFIDYIIKDSREMGNIIELSSLRSELHHFKIEYIYFYEFIYK